MGVEKSDNSSDINVFIKILSIIGTIILENGGETSRAEEAVSRICHGYNKNVEVLVIPTGVFISVTEDDVTYNTLIKRVKKRTINLEKLDRVNTLSRELSERRITLEEAMAQCCMISNSKKKKYNRWLIPVYTGLSSGLFSLLFNGMWFDFIIAFISGFIVQFIAMSFRQTDVFHFLMSLIGGVVCAVTAVLSVNLFGLGSVNIIIISSIMPLLPGLAMIKSIRDTMTGDLVSGTARLAEVVIVAVSLAVGAGVVLSVAKLLGGVI
ncbi:MAG: threonine/serine exporter [Clostridiales bacterium]|nr:MAG: threonine/serine exporter [Clostridiales bacterium]